MKGLYFTSDIAHQDQDGDYQIIGRSDDVIRYKGEMLNIPYIENMVVSVYLATADERGHLLSILSSFKLDDLIPINFLISKLDCFETWIL